MSVTRVPDPPHARVRGAAATYVVIARYERAASSLSGSRRGGSRVLAGWLVGRAGGRVALASGARAPLARADDAWLCAPAGGLGPWRRKLAVCMGRLGARRDAAGVLGVPLTPSLSSIGECKT